MKLEAPCQATDFVAQDIYEKSFKLSDYQGTPLILSFFRDASCPFCNMRVFEFTQKYKEWESLGISVVAVFSSSPEQVREFIAKHPRPFRTVGDPALDIYKQYGVSHSVMGFFKAIAFKMKRIKAGVHRGGKTNVLNPHPFLLPADFLISPNGKIIDLWYGSDPTDHIPMKRIDKFVAKVRVARLKQAKRMQAKRTQLAASKKASLSTAH